MSTLAQDYLMQGAGTYDHRGLAYAVDRLGLARHTALGRESGVWLMGALPKHTNEALRLLSTIVLHPTFPESALEKVRASTLEQIAALEDQPTQKLFVALGEKFFPRPLEQSPLGRREDVEAIRREEVLSHYRSSYHAGGAVLALSGSFEWERLAPVIQDVWGALPTGSAPAFSGPPAQAMRYHVEQESSQMQIGVAYNSLPPGHPDHLKNVILIKVLSGGMSGRLFTEVREKRGLVYSVSASYVGFRSLGAWFCYAGTTPEKSGETLEVIRNEIERLRQGITPEEFAKARLKLMASYRAQGEVVMDRAADLADRWFLTGRIQSVDERIQALQALSLDEVNAFAKTISIEATVLTLGPSSKTSPKVAAKV